MTRLTIALDVMGGDCGPHASVPASINALQSDPQLELLLFGNKEVIDRLLPVNLPDNIRQRIKIHHTDKTIENNQDIVEAIKNSKDSSMRLAIESVKNGEADACVSAGNTGALMGLSKILLEQLPGIERPALVSAIPTINDKCSIMLDLGANIDVDSDMLYQFSVMGSIFMQHFYNIENPRIALLNIGVEENKGTPAIKQASELLKTQAELNYIGFIEGNKLLNHIADVIVTDGFSGNIALKTLEGTIYNFNRLLRHSSNNKNLFNKIYNSLSKIIFKNYWKKISRFNPERYNGANLLGLNSVIVKSHGNATSTSFTYAIQSAALQVRQQIPNKIGLGLQKYNYSEPNLIKINNENND